MTNEEFRERVSFGLELSYRRMLREKALHNEDVMFSLQHDVFWRYYLAMQMVVEVAGKNAVFEGIKETARLS